MLRLPAFSLVAGLLAAVQASAEEVPALRRLAIATGEVTGFHFPVGGSVCRLVNKDRPAHGLHCLVEPSAGSAANIASLRAGEVDLAIVQSRSHYLAFKGEGGYEREGPFQALRALASLHGEALVVVVAKDSGIAKPADLKGKRVNLGRPRSFQRHMAEVLLAAQGLTPADFAAALEMEVDQQKAALCDGRLDAAFFSGVHPMADVQAALAECGASVIDLGGPGIDGELARRPYLARQTLPAAIYDGLSADVATFGMTATLVASDRLPEDVAYRVVKAVFDNFDVFRGMYPVLGALRKEGMVRDGLTAPLHAGADRFYREAGLLP